MSDLGWDLLASSRILNSHALSFLDPPPKIQSRPEVLIEKPLVVLKLLLANYIVVFIRREFRFTRWRVFCGG